MPDKRTILNGNGVGDDVAIGNSFLYTASLSTPVYKIEEDDIEEEYKRFDEAINKSKLEIQELQKHVDNNIKNILAMHILMLEDNVIIRQVKDEIKFYLETQKQIEVLKKFTDGLMKNAKIEYLNDSYNPKKLIKVKDIEKKEQAKK